MKMISGRSNLALTIFCPMNCKNNCSFCTSKKDYVDHPADIYKVLNSIQRISRKKIAKSVTDVVITGGEPFGDMHLLKEIIDRVELFFPNRAIYINTTLADYGNLQNDFILAFIKNNTEISGVSVSRHIGTTFDERLMVDEKIYDIPCPVRINCLLFGNETIGQIIEFRNRFKQIPVSFRADYRTITPENLTCQDNLSLKEIRKGYTYISSETCPVCCTDYFTEGVSFHRGLELTHYKAEGFTVINDLIIKQDGTILYDWNYEYKVE